ncbi:MAG: sodium:solute symporter family protein [Candidatus Zixiibacteriota bacterium]|nr:MAG: sodium:solute symporter family protein [candidate division Zixibacteria bacterium]
MHLVDYLIIAVYLGVLLTLGFIGRLKKDSSAGQLILGGRMLTLPAFVASLVSTWYGGILGVGEYSYRFGLSNWLVFGVPYYLAAFLFALFLAERARRSEVLTIPDRLAQAYDRKTAVAGSVIVYLMTVPAAYVLMVGILCEYLFGWPFWTGVIGGTVFSVVYVYFGGFNSVVRTDLFQFGLMFVGFTVLLVYLVSTFGGIDFLKASAPASHFTWHGGNSGWYVAIWYFIALATLIEPAFYQRCYAARDARVARRGILLSILCWAFFDFLTTTCGVYARAVLPELANPVGSYPALAGLVLPAGLLGLFALALLATVMSTIDSYSFLAASTFSRDIVMRLYRINERKTTFYTRLGLVVTVVLAVVMVLFFKSVVDIWHVFGSIGTPALLVPVFFSFVGRRRLPPAWALTSIVAAGGLSLVWYCSQYFTADGRYWYGVEPIFPGLLVSAGMFLLFSRAAGNITVANREL